MMEWKASPSWARGWLLRYLGEEGSEAGDGDSDDANVHDGGQGGE